MDDMNRTSANVTGECRALFHMPTFMHLAVIPSVVIIVLLATLHGKKIRCGRFSWRPGMVVPVDFLDGDKNRWAYAAAFGAMSNRLFALIVNSDKYWGDDVAAPAWVKRSLLLLVATFETSLVFYPILACLTSPYRLVGGVLGVCYTLTWCIVQLMYMFDCPHTDFPTTIAALNVSYSKLILQWPSAVFFLIIVGNFLYILWMSWKTKEVFVKEKRRLALPHHFVYVRVLLSGNLPKRIVNTFDENFLDTFKYKSIPGFRYPSRILCVLFAGISLSYQNHFSVLMDQKTFYGKRTTQAREIPEESDDSELSAEEDDDDLDESWQPDRRSEDSDMIAVFYLTGQFSLQVGNKASTLFNSYEPTDFWLGFKTIVTVCLWVTNFLVLLLMLGTSFLMLKNYRRHLLQLFRGDRSFLPPVDFSPTTLVATSMRWAGYQTTYLAWGLFIFYTAVGILLMVLTLVMYGVIFTSKWDGVLTLLSWIAPPLVMGLVIFYCQKVWVRFFFLQPPPEPDQPVPLALDNRKAFETAYYITFFLNIAIGAFSSLVRMLLSLVVGLILLGRVDQPIVQRGFERFDRGHRAYLGMLFMDYTHNHPVLRIFCEELLTVLDNSKCLTPLEQYRMVSNKQGGIIRRARWRWYVAYTLIRNPDLIARRKHNIFWIDHSAGDNRL